MCGDCDKGCGYWFDSGEQPVQCAKGVSPLMERNLNITVACVSWAGVSSFDFKAAFPQA